jgi:hypothetical protein
MTPTETVLQTIQRLEGEKRRLERAMRDALDALENQSPAHAERYLREGLK